MKVKINGINYRIFQHLKGLRRIQAGKERKIHHQIWMPVNIYTHWKSSAYVVPIHAKSTRNINQRRSPLCAFKKKKPLGFQIFLHLYSGSDTHEARSILPPKIAPAPFYSCLYRRGAKKTAKYRALWRIISFLSSSYVFFSLLFMYRYKTLFRGVPNWTFSCPSPETHHCSKLWRSRRSDFSCQKKFRPHQNVFFKGYAFLFFSYFVSVTRLP